MKVRALIVVTSPEAVRPRRARRLLALAAALSLIGAGIFWDGYHRTPSGPASGSGLSGRTTGYSAPRSSPLAPRPYLRVASFNIHSGRGPDGRADLGRTAASLRSFDLAALNEVRGAWLAERRTQAEILGRALGRGWLFAPAERRWWHDDFGNGLLSAVPVEGWRRVPLAGRSTSSFRNALHAHVRWRGRTLQVLITHLSPGADRAGQLRSVRGMFLALPAPAVLMGDLNTTAADREMQPLMSAEGIEDPLRSVRRGVPGLRDWILLRGLQTVHAGVGEDGASDHPYVWAELRPAP